jgi:PIN domain nuclease of toxin-antitoxin system
LTGSLLLDTHVVLWWLTDDAMLSGDVKDVLDTKPDVLVSVATLWEVTIKLAMGKLDGPPDLPELIRDCGFLTLPVSAEHAMAAGRLPMLHRDPFDRMLIAQARCNDLVLVTRDETIRRYPVATWAV